MLSTGEKWNLDLYKWDWRGWYSTLKRQGQETGPASEEQSLPGAQNIFSKEGKKTEVRKMDGAYIREGSMEVIETQFKLAESKKRKGN